MEILKSVAYKLRANKQGECLEFIGYCTKDGHGQFQFRFSGNKYNVNAHRAAYSIHHNEELSTDDVIMHTCDNPKCINIEHLKKGTHVDNVADRVSKGRSAIGKQNGRFTHGKYCKTNITM